MAGLSCLGIIILALLSYLVYVGVAALILWAVTFFVPTFVFAWGWAFLGGLILMILIH